MTAGGAPALLPSFYAGREVFVTGGTGFVGKVLLERILWTCPEVSRIHVLMRQKRGQTPQQRLELLTKSQSFDNIRAKCPSQLQKLNLINGDVGQPELGLDKEGFQQLKHVSVVFHVAANVKFFGGLSDLLKHNVYAVEAICDLCDQLPLLESLVYVSTAYSLSDLQHVPEKVLPSPIPLAEVKAIVDAMPKDILDDITLRLIAPKPNHYAFTKCLAENVLLQRPHRHYAIGICRPTIVLSSYRWPHPGWIQGVTSGPCSIHAGVSLGLVHVTFADLNKKPDYIPVDIVVDTMLAIGWEIATDRLSEVRVYNCSSQEHPNRWLLSRKHVRRVNNKYPFSQMLYYPFGFITANRYVYEVSQMLLHIVPLYIANKLTKIANIKTKVDLQAVSGRMRMSFRLFSFFLTTEWNFDTHNFQRLRDRLSAADAEIYNLDVKTVDWEKHTEDLIHGIRKYILQDPDDTIPQAKKRLTRLRRVHYGLMFVLCATLYKLVTLLLYILGLRT